MNFIKESYFNRLGRESTYSFGRAAERERATSVDLEALKNGINEVFEAVGGSSTEKETVLNYTLAQLEIDVYRHKNNFLGRWRLCNNFQNSNFFDKMRPF